MLNRIPILPAWPKTSYRHGVLAILFCCMCALAQQPDMAPLGSAETTAKRNLPPPGTVTGTGTANYIPSRRQFDPGQLNSLSDWRQNRNWHNLPHRSARREWPLNVSKSYRIGGSDVLVVSDGTLGVGVGALQSEGSRTFYNMAIGENALQQNISGTANTAIGLSALRANDSAYNTAVGWVAFQSNVNGTANTAVGEEASRRTRLDRTTYPSAAAPCGITSRAVPTLPLDMMLRLCHRQQQYDVGTYGTATDNGVFASA